MLVQGVYVVVLLGVAWATSSPRTSPADPAPVSRARRRTPRSAVRRDERADAERAHHEPLHHRVGRQRPVVDLLVGAHALHGQRTAPSRRALSGGVTTWSWSVQMLTHAGPRDGARLVQPREQGRAGHELLAGDRTEPGAEAGGQGGHLGAVVRRPQQDDAPRVRGAAELVGPEPRRRSRPRSSRPRRPNRRRCWTSARPRLRPSSRACATRSPVPSPVRCSTTAVRPAARRRSASCCRLSVPPPYPGTSTTGPGVGSGRSALDSARLTGPSTTTATPSATTAATTTHHAR